MKAFIEIFNQLEKLLKAAGKSYGWPEWLVNDITLYFTFFILVLTIVYQLVKFIILKSNQWNQRKLNRDLHPYFSKSDVDRATRYYIPSKYQNVAPSEDDEPGRYYIASPKDQLIPLFLKKAFKFDKDDHRFYLILADAGMGKTTLMINLYLAYKNQWKMPWHLPKYDIKLFPLGAPNILEKVKSIEKKDNTILLLDAFDEDIEALHDHEKRMKEILKVVHEFRVIVITSRTQFFPTEKEEPHKTGYFTFGNENKEVKFQKSYLSVFDDKDIKKYLRKRFSPFRVLKYYKAYKIVKKSPNLMVRPMLLSHIEDLVKSKADFVFGYQIYEVLINKWIEREASKPGIKGKYGSKEKYKELLNEFSHQLAIDLYENKEKRGGYFIARDEGFRKDSALSLTDIEEDNLKLSEAEMRSKSLLNRNAEGEYKFSHKSVLEYFLAKEAAENAKFFLNFSFEGNDAAKNFFSEMVFDKILFPELIKCDGEFSIHDSKFKPLNQLRKSDLGMIKALTIKNIPDDLNIIHLSCLNTLEKLTIFDKEKYKVLYQMYFFFMTNNQDLKPKYQKVYIDKKLRLIDVSGALVSETLVKIIEQFKKLEEEELQERLRELYNSSLSELKVLQERIGFLKPIELVELLKQGRLPEQIELLKPIDLVKLLDQRELNEEDEKKMEALTSYLKKVKLIKERLPSCKLYY